MKSSFKIILLVWLPVLVYAQYQQVQLDSLQLSLKNAANDTVRMYACGNIASYYSEISRDSSLLYSAQSLSLAQKLKLKFLESTILAGRGFVLANIGNYPEALESLYQALKIAEDPAIEKSTLNVGETQSPKNARLSLLGRIHLTMGHLYGATGNNYKKISEYLIAIEFADSVQNTGLKITATMNLGNAYLKLNKLDSALLYEQRTISMISNRPAGYERYDGFAFELLARIYQSKGDFKLSKEAYQKSIGISKEKNNLTALPRTLNFLGEFYQIIKKPDSSVLYAREALQIAKIVALPVEIKNAYKLLSGIYSDQNNKDSTLSYLKLYMALNDSLNKIEKENLLAYQNIGFDEQLRVKKLEEEKIQTKTKTRTNAMLTGLGVFLIIGLILYRNNRQKQKANKVLEKTLTHLKATQSQLIQSEKMASLGELTSGIAHEIQNPLNFVNNFAEINNELIKELEEEAGKQQRDESYEHEIIATIKDNSEKINHHGKRAESIVRGMLQHSQASTGKKEPTDINALAEEYLRLAYHSYKSKNQDLTKIKWITDFDNSLPLVNVIPQDIGRVFLNLFNNAFWACAERGLGAANEKQQYLNKRNAADRIQSDNNQALGSPEFASNSGVRGKTENEILKSKDDLSHGIPSGETPPVLDDYQPTVTLTTKNLNDSEAKLAMGSSLPHHIEIRIHDNGPGIPPNIIDKIFQPFFTTKPTGQGTGLGLSLAYDIIKAHGGTIVVNTFNGLPGGGIKVETKEGDGTEFIIQLPNS